MRIRKENENLSSQEIELIANISDALAHPARVEIFSFIYQENMKLNTKICNKTIVENFDYAQATISQHVKKLADSGLLMPKKEGSFTYYSVNIGILQMYLDAVKKLNKPIQKS